MSSEYRVQVNWEIGIHPARLVFLNRLCMASQECPTLSGYTQQKLASQAPPASVLAARRARTVAPPGSTRQTQGGDCSIPARAAVPGGR